PGQLVRTADLLVTLRAEKGNGHQDGSDGRWCATIVADSLPGTRKARSSPSASAGECEWFPRVEPVRRNRIPSGCQRHDATDDGAGRVAVSQSRHGGPDRFLVIVQAPRSTPEGEWHRIRRSHP